MSERPFLAKPGPPTGSGPDPAPRAAPASGTGPGARPTAPPYGRPDDGTGRVPGPPAPTPQPGNSGPQPGNSGWQPEEPAGQQVEPAGRPEELNPQPADFGLDPEATPDTDKGSRGPVRTSPDEQLGGPEAAGAGRRLTGDAVVDRALDDLDALPGQPLDRHIEVGQRVHRTLQARLADIGRE